MHEIFGENYIILKNAACFNLELTLDCGQAFRWTQQPDGSWSGVADGKYLNIQEKDGDFILTGTNKTDYEQFWRQYFDLERDYAGICETLKQDALLRQTIDDYYGIRILQQDSWEALCTFVISQNNNIKRIRGIIDRLCRNYGAKIREDYYTFPTPQQLKACTAADFYTLGAGYRAAYLESLVKDVAGGRIDLKKIRQLPLEEARNELLTLHGVGVKVADCALLFGFGFLEAFPLDVWMKRVMTHYPDGLPACFKGYEGIAQQYLFHWARNHLQK